MKKILIILGMILYHSILLAQPFQKLGNLFSCGVRQLFEYKGEVYVVTNFSFYVLNDDKWISDTVGISPEFNIFKIKVSDGIFAAITNNGFYLKNESDSFWRFICNDSRLIIDKRKFFAPDISEVVFCNNEIVFIGNHFIYRYDIASELLIDSIEIPYNFSRDFSLKQDSLFIKTDSKAYCYLLKTSKVFDLLPSFKFPYSNENINKSDVCEGKEYYFGDNYKISIKQSNSLKEIYYPYPAVFFKGAVKYKDSYIIGSNKNGLFKFSLIDNKIIPFNNGINEGWFIELFVKKNSIVVSNPDNVYLFSIDYGKSWNIIPTNLKYYSYCFENFKDNMIIGRNNELSLLNNDEILYSFPREIKNMIEYKGSLFILNQRELFYTNDLQNYRKVNLSISDSINFRCLVVYNNELLIKVSNYETYKVDFTSNNEPRFSYNPIIPDSILVHKDNLATKIERPKFSETHYFNDDIFILSNNEVLHSNDGKVFYFIDKQDDIIELTYDNTYLYYSFRGRGIMKKKFK